MERFLNDLINKGTPCDLTQTHDVNKPIISGKIVEICTLVPKGRYQNNDVLVVKLREVYSVNRSFRYHFKAVFIDQAAQLLNNLNLAKDDYLAFCEAKLMKDAAYRRLASYYAWGITIGMWPGGNKIDDCYYKRKEMEHWTHLVALPGNDNFNRNEVTERNNSNATEENDVTNENLHPIRNTETVDRIANHSYRYVKLSEVQKNAKFNVYAVISKVLKKPTISPVTGKYYQMITVIDETNTDNFFVHIFAKTIDEIPLLKMYDIVRFHRLQIEEKSGRIDGRVFSGCDLVVFDKDDTNTRYKTSKNTTLTETDLERVEKLKMWMLENYPEARPFTTINRIQLGLKEQKINLSGEIVKIKVYDDRPDDPTVALRIRDGTKCTVPFFRLSFEADSWEGVMKASKSFHSESEEIDIIVVKPFRNFKLLKAGEKIELFNVRTLPVPETVKTVHRNYLKLWMDGKWDNLKPVCLKRTHSQTDDTSTKDTRSEENVRKRQLFNPDVSDLIFENDDMDINVTNNADLPNEGIAGETVNQNNHLHKNDVETDNTVHDLNEANKKTQEETNNPSCHRANANDVEISNTSQEEVMAEANNLSGHRISVDDVEIGNTCDNINTLHKEVPAGTNTLSDISENVNKRNEITTERNNHNDLSNKNNVCIDGVSSDQNVPNNKAVAETESSNGRLSREENSPTTATSVDLILKNSERPSTHCFVSCSCSESSSKSDKFLTKWPKNPPLLEPFKIRVILASTAPVVDKTSCDDDVMLLLHYFCETCQIFYPYNKTEWNDEDEEDPEPQCAKCGERQLQRLLKLNMRVVDCHFEFKSVVILGKYAEDFLGCSVDDFILIEECRSRVKSIITSYLSEDSEKRVPFVLEIKPMESRSDILPKYHVIGVTSS